LAGIEYKRNHPGGRGAAVLYLLDKLEARAVYRWAMRQGIEVLAGFQAGLVMVEVNPPQHFRGNLSSAK